MAKITSTEAKLSIYQSLAPLVAELSEDLGYVVPIYWPALNFSQPPDRTNVYVEVEENSTDKNPEGIEAVSGSDALDQLKVTILLTERRGELAICQQLANKAVAEFSRGRRYFDVENDKSVILMPCIQEPLTIQDGRRILSFLITFMYETY